MIAKNDTIKRPYRAIHDIFDVKFLLNQIAAEYESAGWDVERGFLCIIFLNAQSDHGLTIV